MSKTIVLSGASSGIGKATARQLLKSGYKVAGLSRRTEKCNDLTEAHPESFLNLKADVTDTASIKSAIDQVLEKFGKIDGLINNAGVGYLGKIETGKLDEWHKMFDVNVSGLLSLTHACIPQLIENRGHVVNIDSVAGHEVYPEGVVYCATKHAVRVMSVGLEKELKGRVKITNISPGPVETEFVEHTTDEEKAAQMKDYFKDVLTSEDIAESILFALSQPAHVAINEITIRPFK